MFVRVVTNKDKYPQRSWTACSHPAHPPLFHKLGVLMIFHSYKLQVAKLVYESLNSIRPSKLLIKFTKVSEMYNYITRFAKRGNIYNNYARTTRFGLKSLQNMGGKIWGSIPNNIRDSTTLSSLMSKMKKTFVHADGYL